MKKPNWRVAGAAGLAAGLTIGGFSLVSASDVGRAVQAVEARESQAAPASGSMLLTLAATPTTHTFDPAPTTKPTAAPSPKVSPEHTASPQASSKATTTFAVSHADSVDSAASAASVDSVNSVNSVNSVASVDSAD